MNTVVLASGESVDSSDFAWREECRQRNVHVMNMRRLNLYQRRDYLANVERKEGPESASRLRAAFTADWEDRKSELRAAAGEAR